MVLASLGLKLGHNIFGWALVSTGILAIVLQNVISRYISRLFAKSMEASEEKYFNLVNNHEQWAALHKKARSGNEGYFSFYSSVANAITTNVLNMAVPIDDHAIVRGHAVFDTCSLVNGRMYRLQIHLDRMFASASAARLPLPFPGDEAANRKRITEIVRATCKASGQLNCDVRFWLTAGTGNLGVTPAGCVPSFYVLCFGGLPALKNASTDGLPEVTVPESLVPLKPRHLAELKSNNYMLNAMTAMAAKDRGGTFGIGVDASGYILESCVLNVVIVTKDGSMRTPPFERLLKGTTVRKAMELAKAHLLKGGAGLLTEVAQGPIKVVEAKQAKELILMAGDTHIFPMVSLDGEAIGDGNVGPVFKSLKELLEKDAKEGDADHERL